MRSLLYDAVVILFSIMLLHNVPSVSLLSWLVCIIINTIPPGGFMFRYHETNTHTTNGHAHAAETQADCLVLGHGHEINMHMRKHIGAWNCIHITPGRLLRNQQWICCLDASMWRSGAWYSQPNMKRSLSNTTPSTATWLYCPASFSNIPPCMSYLPQARERSILSRHFLTQIKCDLPQNQIKLRHWLGSTITEYIFESQTLRREKNDLWDARSLIWRKRFNEGWYNVHAVSRQREWPVICRLFPVLCFQHV